MIEDGMFKFFKLLIFILALNQINCAAKAKKLIDQKQRVLMVSENEKLLKKHEKLEVEQIKKNMARYRDFDKKQYELEEYDLTVFKKAGIPILHYVHKKTKAHFVFIPVDEKDLDELINTIFFKAFTEDDSGIGHLSEYCFDVLKKHEEVSDKESGNLNVLKTPYGLEFEISSNMSNGESFVKNLFKSLKDPDVFKNPEVFELDKKRVVNEIKRRFECNESPTSDVLYYKTEGEVEKVNKLKLKDLKRFYKKYLHPSNMCVVEYVNLYKKDIKKYLKDLDRLFLSNFNYKKLDAKFLYKQKDRYCKVKYPVSSDEFCNYHDKKKCAYKKSKFEVVLTYDLGEFDFDVSQIESLDILFTRFCDVKVSEAVKRMGYCDFRFETPIMDNIHTGRSSVSINLSADDENLVREDVLKKNAKIILNLIKDEICKLDDSELTYVKPLQYFLSQGNVGKNVMLYSKPQVYDSFIKIDGKINLSFALFDEPFSKKCFNVDENNEIKYDVDFSINSTRNNLNFYDVLAEKMPSYITVFEKYDSKKKWRDSIKFKHETFSLPIKFGEKTNSKAAFCLACELFNKYLTSKLTKEKALTYDSFEMPPYFFDVVSQNYTNEQSKKEILKYIISNFNELIKNFKLSRKEFEKFKKFEKENFNYIIDADFCNKNIKSLKKLEKDVEMFCNGEDVVDSKINKNTTVMDLLQDVRIYTYSNSGSGCFLHDSYDEYLKYLGFMNEYCKYIRQPYFKNVNKIVLNKDNIKKVKDYLKIEEHVKQFKKFVKYQKEICNNIDSVKYEDVLKLIRSAKLIKGEELNKILEKDVIKNEYEMESREALKN